MGTLYNRLGKAVLTCTHNLCFKQKLEKYQKFSNENFQISQLKKNMFITCFRNEKKVGININFMYES